MKRNYSIDLLRIISIFFVVCVHYVGWGGLASTSDVSKINLSPVTIKNLSLNKTIYYNYFSADHFNLETGLVYGTLAITLLDEEGKVRVGSINNLVDVYDFDYQKGRFLRNFATKIGKISCCTS